MVWKNYFEDLEGKLEAAAKEPGNADSKSLLISRELHELEHQIYKLKQAYLLTSCSGRYHSKRISDSFQSMYEKHQAWRAIDYEYYLLGEMLMSMDESRPSELMQHRLLFRFLDRLSVENFSYKDIEVTSSGAIRCETNAGFALQYLRNTGLVVDKKVSLVKTGIQELPDGRREVTYEFFNENIHPKSKKKKDKTWNLSFFGFWVTMSFMIAPLKLRGTPVSNGITPCPRSNYFFSTDPGIWKRVQALHQNEDKIFERTFEFINQFSQQPMDEKHIIDVITRYFELYIKYREVNNKSESNKVFKEEIRAIEQDINNFEIVEHLLRNLRLQELKEKMSV
jgi:hypothetical protein